MCIRELRERVAKGGDPTKLHEEPVQHDDSNVEQGILAIFPIMRLWKYLSVSYIVTAVVAWSIMHDTNVIEDKIYGKEGNNF
jgi:hypothetical protein